MVHSGVGNKGQSERTRMLLTAGGVEVHCLEVFLSHGLISSD